MVGQHVYLFRKKDSGQFAALAAVLAVAEIILQVFVYDCLLLPFIPVSLQEELPAGKVPGRCPANLSGYFQHLDFKGKRLSGKRMVCVYFNGFVVYLDYLYRYDRSVWC